MTWFVVILLSLVVFVLILKYTPKWTRTYTVGGQAYGYKQLLTMDYDSLVRLMSQATREKKPVVASWAFQLMWKYGDDRVRCWRDTLDAIGQHDGRPALAALAEIVLDVTDLDWLKQQNHTPWENYLLGMAFLRQARKAKGRSKYRLKKRKLASLHFLGAARSALPTEESGQVAASSGKDSVPFDALAPLVAAGYEDAFYLRYKGTSSKSKTLGE